MIKLHTLIFLVPLFILSSCSNFEGIKAALPLGKNVNMSTGNYWLAEFSVASGLNYTITFPKEYHATNKQWPLILYLHSMAERGNNIDLVMENTNGQGITVSSEMLKSTNLPFIILSPLCPESAYWPFLNAHLNTLLKEITTKYHVDLKRIYLTGVSMGGMGVWSLAMEYPEWFAAIAPISGGVFVPFMRENIPAIKNIPVWAFHDLYDEEISIRADQETVERLKDAGGKVKYTISDTGKHYINNDIYNRKELYNWFLENKKP